MNLPLHSDPQKIAHALSVLFQDGDVIEMRVPRTEHEGTVSGYFSDRAALAKALAARNGDPGIYMTLNPAAPALLARCANRVRTRARVTTSDRDIQRRRWILIDCDPVRPAEISSSDLEHDAALERARAIRFDLAEEGWPAPVLADSGNGSHLLYRVDLANDDASTKLIESVLKALAARFNDAAVKVDESVFNPSRIIKCYGTVSRKGDDTPDRPHRRSQLLDVPQKIEPVSHALLEELAAEVKEPDPPRQHSSARGGQFDVEAFLARHLDARAPVPHEGGRKWILENCPFNSDHKTPDAAVFERADRSLAFHCFHNSCASRTWRDLRALFEEPRPQSGQANERRQARTEAPDNRPKPDAAIAAWPAPLKPAAFTGIIGQLVEIVMPHSECDPAALVIQLLTAIGNLIGRGPYFMAQGTRHHLNLFNVLVGTTSRGRKGSSLDQALLPLRSVDEHWVNRRIASGLSSGEGLIYRVRDPVEKQEAIKEKGRVKGYQTVIADPGESDKRLLVVEPEFARVLQVAEREANTLSPVVRMAWDSGNLQNLTKNSPLTATAAHISIIGHITKAELDRFLTDTAIMNGFSNRFGWVCVRRSKLLPEGGELHRVDLAPISRKLTQAVDFARRAGEMSREDSLRDQWAEFYARCARGGTGLFDAATSRAEPQTMRIACLYALLDQCSRVQQAHLDAGIAVWTYNEDSARFLFGDKIGDATADQILVLLRATAEGLTQSELSGHFSRNKTAAELKRALGVLQPLALIRSEEEETGGRPVTRWLAV